MNELETELRDVMRERAGAIVKIPPMSFRKREQQEGASGRRRWVVTLVAAATISVGVGVAIAQVMSSSSVTPASDRYTIASGEQGDGSWQLTLYKAEIKTNELNAPGWCLDLDGPSVNDQDRPATMSENICTIGEKPSWSGAIGAIGGQPRFVDGQTLIYGELSKEVARVEVRIGDAEAQAATLVPAPEGTPAGLSYFTALMPGSGEIEVVALDEAGQVLEKRVLRRWSPPSPP